MGITTSSDEFGPKEGGEVGIEEDTEAFEVFYRPATEVRARQLDGRAVIDTERGAVAGDRGDWVIEEPDGTRRVCADETFRDTYRGTTVAANRALDGTDAEE